MPCLNDYHVITSVFLTFGALLHLVDFYRSDCRRFITQGIPKYSVLIFPDLVTFSDCFHNITLWSPGSLYWSALQCFNGNRSEVPSAAVELHQPSIPACPGKFRQSLFWVSWHKHTWPPQFLSQAVPGHTWNYQASHQNLRGFLLISMVHIWGETWEKKPKKQTLKFCIPQHNRIKPVCVSVPAMGKTQKHWIFST